MEKEVLFKYEKKFYHTVLYQDVNDINNKPSPRRNPKKNGVFSFLTEFKGEENYVENFANKLASVRFESSIVVVEKYDDKVSLKFFTKVKRRSVGTFYFSEKKNVNYVTYNLKTNDIYVGSIEGYQRKVRAVKRVSKNPYKKINHLMHAIQSILSQIHSDHYMEKHLCFETFKKHIGYGPNNYIEEIVFDLSKKYYISKGVKIPNNFKAFVTTGYGDNFPPLKVIRKHKNKFIDAFMSHNLLSGNELKKQLHLCDTITNIHGYKSLLDIFGYDRLYKSDMIKVIITSATVNNYWGVLPTDLSNKQTDVLLNYFKWVYNGLITSFTLGDHIRYYEFLKSKGGNISFGATTIDEFVNEHSLWSVMESSYRNGYVTRQYPQHFYEGITETIDSFNGGLYYPVLLTNTTDYENESATQNNCVRGYVGKSNCFVVSLREGSEESTTRATIEYRISYDEKKKRIVAERVQSLGKHNQKLHSSWDTPLEILDKKVNELMKLEFTINCKTDYQNGKIEKAQLIVVLNGQNESKLGWSNSNHNTKDFIDELEF
jgi:hypothetical protein